MNELISALKSNTIVMESLTDIISAQEPKDRLHYKEYATEAVMSHVGKGEIIQKLYTDITKKNTIDYGKIPDSKGDITMYKYYGIMRDCIDHIVKLLDGKGIPEEVQITQELHDLIVRLKPDFQYGFKMDIEFIKITYCTLVMTLHEMINLSIRAYTMYMNDTHSDSVTYNKLDPNSLQVFKYAKAFIASYKKGEWNTLMNTFKKNGSNFLGSVAMSLPVIGIGVGIFVGIISLMGIIRGLIYVYYSSASKLNQYIKIQSEFLQLAISASDKNTKGLDKQKAAYDRMQNISTFIEAKILKVDKQAK